MFTMVLQNLATYSKEDKTTHGYGLKSVNRIVKKYEGDISYTIEEDTFEICIYFYDMILLDDNTNIKGENLGGDKSEAQSISCR